MLKNPTFGILLFLFISSPLLSQDLAHPFGWATIEGGTTGGKGGPVDTVDAASEAKLSGLLGGTEPHIVYISGRLTGGTLTFGSNKTLIGLPGTVLDGPSLILAGSANIIIRNLDITKPTSGEDGIRITESSHIWIDHCRVANGRDGNLDITRNSDIITVSFCIFEYDTQEGNHRFSNLIASSDKDEGEYRITYIYNWWRQNVRQRMPRMRFTKCHIVNNLYTTPGNGKCVGAGHLAKPLVEGNVFIGVHNPIQIRTEGSASLVEARNNLFINTTGTTEGPGKAFVPPYSLSVMPPETVEEYVRQNAGPVDKLDKVTAMYRPVSWNVPERNDRISISRSPTLLIKVKRAGTLEWIGVDGRVQSIFKMESEAR